MTLKAEILARFSGQASQRPLYLPDLSLWYDWHHAKRSLPGLWGHNSLPQIARALGVPIWLAVRPWRVETPGVKVLVARARGERIVRSETAAGTIAARWTRGPDGAWWQTEYPVKSHQDLAAALELAKARSYVLDTARLAELEAMVGDDGVLAVELPRRPYSDLLHEFLGWGEGLLLLGEPIIDEIVAVLEDRLQQLVPAIAGLPAPVVLSPDNLDGQYISPAAFQTYLADSYQRTAQALHRHGQYLLVHAGGPVKRLLAPLAASGVDGVEGVAGPPQGDVSLAEARASAGPGLTLWGGIPQDLTLATHTQEEFEAAVMQAAREAVGDGRMLLGVADRVPVDAELGRLWAIPGLVKRAWSA